ncbi:MAG: MBL fold metallo-hydrolase [Acidobacteriota bacterium]
MIIERFVVGMLQTNCYLLGDPQARKAVVIDPGGDAARLASRIQELGLDLAAIVNTHAHFDHVMDAWSLKGKLGGEIYLHEKDQALLQDRMVGMGAMFSEGKAPKVRIDRSMKEGDVLEFGAIRMTVLETPGHTPGHVSLHVPDARVIFVGDLIFAGSIGRTDFPGGSYDHLLRSVREKIFTLDGATVVYPGHGPETTVEREKRTNPFFN